MAAAAGFTSGIGLLALEMWTDDVVHSALVEESVFYGMCEKDWACYGNPLVEGITYGGDGGTSSQFSVAQANFLSGGHAKWQYGLFDEHAVWQITNKLALSMRGNKGAMVDALTEISGKQFDKFMRNICLDFHRDQGGSRGVVAVGGSATAVLQLADIDDAIHFNIGDVIASDDTDGNGVGPADDGEYIRIIAVDPVAGTLTKDGAAWNAGGNFADGYFLFHEGTIGLKPQGIPSWIPRTDPTATLYNGINRTLQPVMLAGQRFVADAAKDGTMPRALQRQAAEIQRFGGKPDCCLLNPLDWTQCAAQMGNPETRIIHPKGRSGMPVAHIGYDVIMLNTGKGQVKLMSTVDQPQGRNDMLSMKTWKICGNREPGLDKMDSNEKLRLTNEAGTEGRFEAYFNPVCKLPGHNSTGNLTAVLNN